MEKEIKLEITKYLDYFLIGEKATSYKMPLVIENIKEYEGKICIETKNIKGYYIVFDKNNFLEMVNKLKG